MRGWLTTRQQTLLVAVGSVVCLAVAPAAALACGPTTVAPNPGSTRLASCTRPAVHHAASVSAAVEPGEKSPTASSAASPLDGASCTISSGCVTSAEHGGTDTTACVQPTACSAAVEDGNAACTAVATAHLDVHIFEAGTTVEVPGGSVTIDAPAGVASAPNPVLGFSVLPADTDSVAATAPSGWTLVNNPAQPDVVAANGDAAHLVTGITVPAGQTAAVVFYATQLVAAGPAGGSLTVHIYRSGTTTEVDNGLVSVNAGTPVDNPVVSLQLAPGVTDTVSATAPNGWAFVDNGSLDSITGGATHATLIGGITLGSAQQALVVFYVVPASGCGAAPCAPAAAHLTLAKTVDKPAAVIGDTVMYTITLANTGNLASGDVTVRDLIGGDASYLVNDGTGGTVNSFAGSPLVTIDKLATGHYSWTYPSVKPGDVDAVSFTVLLRLPVTTLPTSNAAVALTNTASTAGTPPVTVTTTAPYSGGQGATPGAVQGISTATPSTGVSLNVALAGYLFLGGLGLILLGVLARPRERAAIA